MDDLHNLAGLARLLGISRAWLRNAAKRGTIPSLKVGRKRLFSVGAVRRALIEQATRSEGEARS